MIARTSKAGRHWSSDAEMLLTNSNCEREQSEASDSVLDEVRTAGAQQGGASLVILAVVGGVEADEQRLD